MPNALQRLWWNLSQPGWNTVRRTVHHELLGELKYEGTRQRPGGYVNGAWRVSHPDVAKPISVGFPTMGGEPTPKYMDRLAELLADQDGLFERLRPAIAPVFSKFVERPLPADWRSVFSLDNLDLRPAPEDIDEDGETWQVVYWCPPAEHWFVIALEGDAIIDVNIEG